MQIKLFHNLFWSAVSVGANCSIFLGKGEYLPLNKNRYGSDKNSIGLICSPLGPRERFGHVQWAKCAPAKWAVWKNWWKCASQYKMLFPSSSASKVITVMIFVHAMMLATSMSNLKNITLNCKNSEIFVWVYFFGTPGIYRGHCPPDIDSLEKDDYTMITSERASAASGASSFITSEAEGRASFRWTWWFSKVERPDPTDRDAFHRPISFEPWYRLTNGFSHLKATFNTSFALA